MAGYSGTPLARKLGITDGSAVLLDGAPPGFALGDPPTATVHRRPGRRPYDVIVCFCPSAARLAARWPTLHTRTTPAGALWVAWPKRSARTTTDLDEQRIREFALAHGRVDVKVCAIDDTWSALKHVVRLRDR